jgi:hypothetical protein
MLHALITKVFAGAIARAQARKPDVVIGGQNRPYLLRWFLIPRNPIFNVYLHRFLRSDDDRALHDHPWPWCSILLHGSYVEWSKPRQGSPLKFHVERFDAGSVRFHRARYAHRLELRSGECWTLFITGPRIRQWGFHCPRGWVHWKDFTDPNDAGAIGPGCGE